MPTRQRTPPSSPSSPQRSPPPPPRSRPPARLRPRTVAALTPHRPDRAFRERHHSARNRTRANRPAPSTASARRGGVLYGEPILLKDNIEAAGPLPTTAGSLALANNVTNRDAPLVARLRQADAVILGKANPVRMGQFPFRGFDLRLERGSAARRATRTRSTVRRAVHLRAALAAVASGMVAIAIGTETNGSITCPAAMQGLVGFKTLCRHGQPHAHRADQRDAGYRRPDHPVGTRRRARHDRHRRQRPPPIPRPQRPIVIATDFVAALDAQALRGTRLGVLRFATGFKTDDAFDRALDVLRARGAILIDIDEFGREPLDGNPEYDLLLTEFKDGVNALSALHPGDRKGAYASRPDRLQRRDPRANSPPSTRASLKKRRRPISTILPMPNRRPPSPAGRGADGIDRLLAEHDVAALVRADDRAPPF